MIFSENRCTLFGIMLLFGIDLPRRPDILVHAEQVGGVVTPLDLGQAAIVRAIRFLDPVDFVVGHEIDVDAARGEGCGGLEQMASPDRKSTRLNSSHLGISYA